MAKSIDERVFYHGTYPDVVPLIEAQGLKNGIGGHLNVGVYVSENWRTASWFGQCLYQVKLRKGTKILDLSTSYDKKTIGYLTREFGKGLIKAENPTKLLPKKKHLTNKELINLMRYFFHKIWSRPVQWKRNTKNVMVKMDDAIHRIYRGSLIRHGYHGYGHPKNEIGFVLFQPDQIESAELKTSIPSKIYCAHWNESDQWMSRFPTLEDLIRKVNDFNANNKKSNQP